MTFKDVITPVVSVICIFISFGLGKWTNTNDYSNAQLEKRYIKFYMPFFAFLARNRYPDTDCYRLCVKNHSQLINLLNENLQYMTVEEAGMFKDIYFLSLKAAEFATGKYPENEHFVNELNSAFRKFVSINQASAQSIALKLKLEPVSSSIL